MRSSWVWRSVVVGWAVLVWVALWSDLSVANVVWGAVIGLVSLRLLPLPEREAPVTFRPLAALRYLLFAAWSLVKSSAYLAYEVVTPTNRINQAIVEVPLRTRSRGVATLVANTVSLTPGTLTLEIRRDPPALYVHIMHLGSVDELRAEIAHLEDLALAAFPDVPTRRAPSASAGEIPAEEKP